MFVRSAVGMTASGIRRAAGISIFLLSTLTAHADPCSSVIPGAQLGPSPNFNNWPWTNACYISWPGTDSRDYSRNPRLEYERRCKATAGFLHFEGDFGSNRNTCIFEAPRESEALPQREPAPREAPSSNDIARPETPPPTPPSFGDNDYDIIRTIDPDGAPTETDFFHAQIDQDEGEVSYQRGEYLRAYNAFMRLLYRFSNKDRDVKTRSAKAEQFISYAKCMANIAAGLQSEAQIEEATRKAADACPHATGRFVQDGLARLDSARGKTSPPAPRRQTEAVDSQCLMVRAPRNTGVGCAKGKVWLMTLVDVSQQRDLACPKTVHFLFSDEEGQQHNEAPTTLQTCGTPPWNIRPAP